MYLGTEYGNRLLSSCSKLPVSQAGQLGFMASRVYESQAFEMQKHIGAPEMDAGCAGLWKMNHFKMFDFFDFQSIPECLDCMGPNFGRRSNS